MEFTLFAHIRRLLNYNRPTKDWDDRDQDRKEEYSQKLIFWINQAIAEASALVSQKPDLASLNPPLVYVLELLKQSVLDNPLETDDLNKFSDPDYLTQIINQLTGQPYSTTQENPNTLRNKFKRRTPDTFDFANYLIEQAVESYYTVIIKMLNVLLMAIILQENPSKINQKLYGGYIRNDIYYNENLPPNFKVYINNIESLISNLEATLEIIRKRIPNNDNELLPKPDLWLRRLIAIFLSASRTPLEFMLARCYPNRTGSIADTFATYGELLKKIKERSNINESEAQILDVLLGVYYDRQT
ncbi:MAG: hypothetical protein KatS3mg090_0754 [Patescibacteria group bacterium]|nr:MAG: hypothetical protein KatS3mg090_0754 [Patescibacteria group bacterium]